MAAMVGTRFEGEVVWLGFAPGQGSLRSVAGESLDLGFAGLDGARHHGETRASCVRVTDLYPKGTTIRNVRQVTILSAEDLAAIAGDIGTEGLDPGMLGANIVVRGIPDFTHVPPSARLQGPSGMTLCVDMENLPCVLPGREIEAEAPGHGAKFRTAARGRRGVTAWVERPGGLTLGERLRLFVPAQRAWNPEQR